MITASEISNMVEQNREEAIRCLQEIIKTPSVTGEEGPVSNVLEAYLKQAGLDVERVGCEKNRDCLIAEWSGTQPGKRFIFNGHMDVFPPPQGIGAKEYDPWGAQIKGGFMYGRGTSDMKGGDVAALLAVIFLRRMGFDPKGSVVLSFMVDEENGGEKGVKYLISKNLLNGDFGLCMEPTGGKIVNKHWGILRMTVCYTAIPHHVGQPGEKPDALEKAVTAIHRLYALNKALNQDKRTASGVPCLTVTIINAGNTPNVSAGEAKFVVDRRIALHEDPEAAKAQLLKIFEDLKAANPEYEYTYQITSDRPPMNTEEEDSFVQLVARSYEQITGKMPQFAELPGGSDAASLHAAYGYPIPLLGSAETFGDYGSGGNKERTNIEDWLTSIKYYMMTVVNALS